MIIILFDAISFSTYSIYQYYTDHIVQQKIIEKCIFGEENKYLGHIIIVDLAML